MSLAKWSISIAVATTFTGSAAALAQHRLLASQETHGFGFGYGESRYVNFSAELDARFDSVDTVPNLEDLTQMMQYEAVMVQIRAFGSTLSPTEKTNLAAYIATGRPVLMIGENPSLWYQWNVDLCTVAGGTATNQESNGDYNVANQVPILTDGVTTVNIPNGGIASGGTNIFTVNTATLWAGNGSNNVLTMLDVNVFEDTRWNTLDGGVFSTNVAQWLSVGGSGGGLILSLGGDCPGRISVNWSGATPSKQMGIVFAGNTGNFTVPNGPCSGTQLGLGSQNLRLVNTVNTGNGSGQTGGDAGTAACNGYLQLVVIENPCTTSNVAQIR